MALLVALLLVAAVAFAVLAAFGVPARVGLGWLAVACLAAAFAVPAAAAL
jgi:hypothetical protein